MLSGFHSFSFLGGLGPFCYILLHKNMLIAKEQVKKTGLLQWSSPLLLFFFYILHLSLRPWARNNILPRPTRVGGERRSNNLLLLSREREKQLGGGGRGKEASERVLLTCSFVKMKKEEERFALPLLPSTSFFLSFFPS